jgi:ribosomal protein S18
MLDTEELNTTMPRAHAMPKEEKEFMDNFKLPTSSERHAHHQPGNRHCEGKKQRRGKNGDLNCHLIDLDTLSPFDVTLLRRFITIDSEIVPRYQTGLCAKCQRKVAKCIKQSRNLGILPHLSEFVVKDQAPWKDDAFHTTAGKGKTTTRSGEGSYGREDIFVSKTAAV